MTTLTKNELESGASSKYTLGGSCGIAFQSNLQKHFSMRTGIVYEQLSYYEDLIYQSISSSDYYYSRSTNKVDYLTIPILAKFTFGKRVHFFFNTGSYLSVPTKFNAFKQGLSGGAGIGIPVKKYWYLSLEFRDNLCIIDVSKNSNYGGFISIPSNTFTMLLGVTYKLGLREENK